MRKKIIVFVTGILTLSVESFAQNKDSMNMPKRAETYAADRFAIARPLNIEFIYTAPYNFTSEKAGKTLPESRVTGFSQLKMSANINFIKRKSWLLGATIGYRYTTIDADIIEPVTGGIKTFDNDYHYLFSSVNFSYFSTLFNKRTIYTSSILVDGSDQHFERVKGLVTATMILKANRRTKIAAGLLVNIDPSAQSFFIPTFSLEHKFSNSLIADVVFPRYLYLRKYVWPNGRISLGADIDRTSFYLYDIDGTSQRYEYRQMDVNSGLTYEHVIAKRFVLTAKTGVKFTSSGRLFRKEDSFGDPVYETKPDPAFFMNVGVSFNPFSVFGKKK